LKLFCVLVFLTLYYLGILCFGFLNFMLSCFNLYKHIMNYVKKSFSKNVFRRLNQYFVNEYPNGEFVSSYIVRIGWIRVYKIIVFHLYV
jgi:hypothetical protein